MKRFFGMLLVLSLLLAGSAFAAESIAVPGAPTQDAVLSTAAVWQDENKTAFELTVAEPDQLTADTLASIYTFVVKENNRPVRYFSEDVQKAIAAMLNGNPDALCMSDFLRMTAAEADVQADLVLTLALDANVEPGQFAVALLGDVTAPDAIVWTAVETKVVAEGQVECLIPQTVAAQLQGKDVLFALMTGKAAGEDANVQLPSKTAGDIAGVAAVKAEDGAVLAADFEVAIVDETETVAAEAAKLQEHIKTANLPASEFFGEDVEKEIQVLLGADTDVKSLVVYEYAAVAAKNYKDEYNNVIAAFHFATPYADGQKVVAVVTLADAEKTIWLPQRAEVKDGAVDIVFDRLALSKMAEAPAMLVLLSEAIAE